MAIRGQGLASLRLWAGGGTPRADRLAVLRPMSPQTASCFRQVCSPASAARMTVANFKVAHHGREIRNPVTLGSDDLKQVGHRDNTYICLVLLASNMMTSLGPRFVHCWAFLAIAAAPARLLCLAPRPQAFSACSCRRARRTSCDPVAASACGIWTTARPRGALSSAPKASAAGIDQTHHEVHLCVRSIVQVANASPCHTSCPLGQILSSQPVGF